MKNVFELNEMNYYHPHKYHNFNSILFHVHDKNEKKFQQILSKIYFEKCIKSNRNISSIFLPMQCMLIT